MREYQLGLGIPREQVYNQTMYILVGMLVMGLICNLLVRPLNPKWFMTDSELAEEKRLAHEKAVGLRTAPHRRQWRQRQHGQPRGGGAGLARGGHSPGLGHLPHAAKRGQVFCLSIPLPID